MWNNKHRNQNAILSKYTEEYHLRGTRFFVNDGISGTTFDRPGLNEMFALVDEGEVAIIVVKDMSRFGRATCKLDGYEGGFCAFQGFEKGTECQIAQSQKRVDKLDVLFRKIYEDNAGGKLPDERLMQLTSGYDLEQKTLREPITVLEKEIDQQEQQTTQVEDFIAKCKRCSSLEELTLDILNDLVQGACGSAGQKHGGAQAGYSCELCACGNTPPPHWSVYSRLWLNR